MCGRQSGIVFRDAHIKVNVAHELGCFGQFCGEG